MKHSKDIQQRIRVPEFTGYQNAVMVEIAGDYYWCTDYHEVSDGTIEYALDWAGPTSTYSAGQQISGVWKRLPYMSDPTLKENISEKPVVRGYITIPGTIEPLTIGSERFYPLYGQISGFDSDNKLKIKAFVLLADGLGQLQSENCPLDTGESYPTFADIIEDVGVCTGLDARRIIDFSVSPRSPFRMTRDANGIKLPLSYRTASQYGVVYDAGLEWANTAVDPWTYETITETGDPTTATIGLLDYNRNNVMNISPAVVTLGTNNQYSFTLGHRTVADISGIYTTYRESQSGAMITITEPKLPYLENMLDTYRAYQLNVDRMIMDNSVKYAAEQARIDKANAEGQALGNAISGIGSAILMAPLSGGISGVAGAGASAVGSLANLYFNNQAIDRKKSMEIMQAKDTFNVSKAQAVSQPQTIYQSPYGLVGVKNAVENPVMIGIMTNNIPDGNLEAAYRDMYGWKADGFRYVNLEDGYIRGQIAQSNNIGGRRWDDIVETFSNGFRVKAI